jgi:hypothetical protein
MIARERRSRTVPQRRDELGRSGARRRVPMLRLFERADILPARDASKRQLGEERECRRRPERALGGDTRIDKSMRARAGAPEALGHGCNKHVVLRCNMYSQAGRLTLQSCATRSSAVSPLGRMLSCGKPACEAEDLADRCFARVRSARDMLAEEKQAAHRTTYDTQRHLVMQPRNKQR